MRAPERPALPWWLADTLTRSYQRVTAVVAPLSDADFERPTRCDGLTVGALVVHLLLDAERALMAFATPTTSEADRDFVTYWRDFPGVRPTDSTDEARAPLVAEASQAHGAADAGTRFVRAVAAAYERPSAGLVRQWTDVSQAAGRAAQAAMTDPDQRFGTQGHVLTARDLVATLVVEATVHHLDLILDLPGAPEPDPEGLQVTARTLDALFGPDAWDVIGWDMTTYLLKATGRSTLTDQDLAMLGSTAARLPLLG